MITFNKLLWRLLRSLIRRCHFLLIWLLANALLELALNIWKTSTRYLRLSKDRIVWPWLTVLRMMECAQIYQKTAKQIIAYHCILGITRFTYIKVNRIWTAYSITWAQIIGKNQRLWKKTLSNMRKMYLVSRNNSGDISKNGSTWSLIS